MTEKIHIMPSERDPLKLGSLPLISPPDDDWLIIEGVLGKQNRRRRMVALAGGALAIAASVILAIGVFTSLPSGVPSGEPDLTPLQISQAENPASNDVYPDDTLHALIALSQQLESNLRKIRSRSGVMPASSVVFQVELEDLVAQVDEELSMNPDSINLWSQRINLMLDLSQLYQNELRREYHRMASL